MADITITPADVSTSVAGAGRTMAIAGEAINAGQLVYIKSTDSKAYLADADVTTGVTTAVVAGMAINSAAAAQPVAYQGSGAITVGAVLGAMGDVLVLSGTAGKMCPAADITSGDVLTIVGYATATNAMVLDITATGLRLA